METLTDLEAAALGCTYGHQPCTAHFIRTQFRNSPSARFSDSAGSIYPMMRRLEQRGMLASQVRREGRRDVRSYTTTAAGRRAIKAWLQPPFGPNTMCTHDPLRTRLLYLELLSPRQRLAWLAEAERALEELLVTIDDYRPASVASEVFFDLANENARLETRARLTWIGKARARLAQAGLLAT